MTAAVVRSTFLTHRARSQKHSTLNAANLRVGFLAYMPASLRKSHPTSQHEMRSDDDRGIASGPKSGPGLWEWSANLLDKIVFCGLLAVIALTTIPYGTVEPWSEGLFECAIFVLVMLWIIQGLLSGTWRASGRSMLLPLLALAIFAFAQTLPLAGGVGSAVSSDPYGTRLVVLKLLAFTLFLALLLSHTYNRYRLRSLAYFIIGIGVASALFGMVRQATQRTTGFVLPRLVTGKGYGQFIYHNAFASLMVMTLGLVVGLILRAGIRRDHLLIYLAITSLLFAALVLSNSRGGIFSLVSQMVLLGLLYGARRSPPEELENRGGARSRLLKVSRSFIVRTAIIAGLIIALAMSIFWLGGDRLVNKLAQDEILEQDQITAQSGFRGLRRVDVWRETWQLIKANPVTGIGFGAYWVAIDGYLNTSGRIKPYQAHNDYLDILASGGLIGVALAGWFVFAVIKRARTQLRSTDSFRRAACFGALVGLLGVAVHSLFDFGLQITSNAVVFIVLIVIATIDISGTAERDRVLEKAAGEDR